jgi:hypothetical protein
MVLNQLVVVGYYYVVGQFFRGGPSGVNWIDKQNETKSIFLLCLWVGRFLSFLFQCRCWFSTDKNSDPKTRFLLSPFGRSKEKKHIRRGVEFSCCLTCVYPTKSLEQISSETTKGVDIDTTSSSLDSRLKLLLWLILISDISFCSTQFPSFFMITWIWF